MGLELLLEKNTRKNNNKVTLMSAKLRLLVSMYSFL